MRIYPEPRSNDVQINWVLGEVDIYIFPVLAQRGFVLLDGIDFKASGHAFREQCCPRARTQADYVKPLHQ
jgi:hypothetical protein